MPPAFRPRGGAWWPKAQLGLFGGEVKIPSPKELAAQAAAQATAPPPGYAPPHSWVVREGLRESIPRPRVPEVEPWPASRELPLLQEWLRAQDDEWLQYPLTPANLDFENYTGDPHPWDVWRVNHDPNYEYGGRELWEQAGAPIPIGYPEESLETILARLAVARQRGYGKIGYRGNESYHDAAQWLVADRGDAPSDPIAQIRYLKQLLAQSTQERIDQGRRWTLGENLGSPPSGEIF